MWKYRDQLQHYKVYTEVTKCLRGWNEDISGGFIQIRRINNEVATPPIVKVDNIDLSVKTCLVKGSSRSKKKTNYDAAGKLENIYSVTYFESFINFWGKTLILGENKFYFEDTLLSIYFSNWLKLNQKCEFKLKFKIFIGS